MANYYYALMSGDDQVRVRPNGPFPDWDGAIAELARLNSQLTLPRKYRDAVLLDLGSIDFQNEREVATLLLIDPALRAIFELGRRHGEENDHA